MARHHGGTPSQVHSAQCTLTGSDLVHHSQHDVSDHDAAPWPASTALGQAGLPPTPWHLPNQVLQAWSSGQPARCQGCLTGSDLVKHGQLGMTGLYLACRHVSPALGQAGLDPSTWKWLECTTLMYTKGSASHLSDQFDQTRPGETWSNKCV